MKKFTYLLAVAAVLTACNGGNKGYTVTGTIENAADGDSVFLETTAGREFVKLGSAAIKNGSFTFEGTQDTAKIRYITYKQADKDPMTVNFFLENGKINVKLTQEESSATGTANNDVFQEYRAQTTDLEKKAIEIYNSMSDSTLTDDQRAAKGEEMDKLQNEMMELAKNVIKKNITNPVGVYLLKNNFYAMNVEELEPLMSQIPAMYDNDERVIKIKKNVENMKATAVGQKFTDFEMLTPEGKAVKLSDYVGKGKVVLIDFWASWCGPCRREMPNLVEAYAKYKNKNFEIVGVSLDRDGKAWQEGIEKLNITWPQMSDLKFWESEGAGKYAVSSIPHIVLIDGEGTIIARGLHGEELQKKLAEVIK